jgi:2-oxo-3-hexenedioate decarboxylase
MALDKNTILGLAEHLETAELQAHDVTKITDEHPDMDWADAYAIQDEIRRRKEARRQDGGPQVRPDLLRQDEADGRGRAGLRLRQRLHEPARGRAIAVKELIHPKVEAEICVVTKAPLRAPAATWAR